MVGLGNPGARYRATRHNVGARVVERVAARAGIAFGPAGLARSGRGRWLGAEVVLLEPQTFMNASGGAVLAAVGGLPQLDPARDLLVVIDDVDLPLGRLRLRARGGDGGHRGLRDVLRSLGRRDIPRLRFGVGRPPVGTGTVEHVLEEFAAEEEPGVERACELACDAVACFVRDGIDRAMDGFNAVGPEIVPS